MIQRHATSACVMPDHLSSTMGPRKATESDCCETSSFYNGASTVCGLRLKGTRGVCVSLLAPSLPAGSEPPCHGAILLRENA